MDPKISSYCTCHYGNTDLLQNLWKKTTVFFEGTPCHLYWSVFFFRTLAGLVAMLCRWEPQELNNTLWSLDPDPPWRRNISINWITRQTLNLHAGQFHVLPGMRGTRSLKIILWCNGFCNLPRKSNMESRVESCKKTNKESVENHHAVKESEALLAAGSFNTLP